MNIFPMLRGVDYIVVNNQLAVPDFICGSDDCPDDDDVALSCKVDGRDIRFTVADLEDAEPMTDGAFWVEGVGSVGFLSRAGLH